MSTPMYDNTPAHLDFPIDSNGEGPAEGEEIDRVICWSCGTDWPCEGSKNE